MGAALPCKAPVITSRIATLKLLSDFVSGSSTGGACGGGVFRFGSTA
jgi:hypothetical protein